VYPALRGDGLCCNRCTLLYVCTAVVCVKLSDVVQSDVLYTFKNAYGRFADSTFLFLEPIQDTFVEHEYDPAHQFLNFRATSGSTNIHIEDTTIRRKKTAFRAVVTDGLQAVPESYIMVATTHAETSALRLLTPLNTVWCGAVKRLNSNLFIPS